VATKKKAVATKKSPAKKAARSKPSPRRAEPSPADPHSRRFRDIVDVFNQSGLADLEYEDQDLRIRVSRYAAASPTAPAAPPPAPLIVPAPAAPGAVPAPAAVPEPAAAAAPELVTVSSPFVGTFYLAPSPEAPPFVDVGQRVVKGQTLCIVEAMKLMNEIPSDVSGTVAEVLVQNGDVVQYGDALFRIAQ
jgi:acetyl-CoA carboxylase biotin carboxyl carrier protein